MSVRLTFVTVFFAINTLLFCSDVLGQKNRIVKVRVTDPTSLTKQLKYLTEAEFVDSTLASQKSLEIIRRLQSEGHLLAELIAVFSSEDSVVLKLQAGPAFEWANLKVETIPRILLLKWGYKENLFNEKPVRFDRLQSFIKKSLDYNETHGYPFSKLRFDSIVVASNAISANLIYEPGPLITFDSLQIIGEVNIKRSFLASYLGIERGSLYNQTKLDQIYEKIDALSYIEVSQPLELTFQNNEASLKLFLKNKKVNTVDGIVGLLPNERIDGRFLLTGQFDLNLQNLFASGKNLNVKWQSLKPLSQLLNLSYYHPNLFRSDLNLKTTFNILKEDTTFVNRNFRINFDYNLSSENSFYAFTEFRSSNLLSTTQFRFNEELPDFSDVRLNNYGIGFQESNLDTPLNPKRGLALQLEAALGTKEILMNAGLPEEVYQGVPLNTTQYTLLFGIDKYSRISDQFVLFNSLNGGIIFNERLFFNDLFRVGGLNSLRGFNDNFFFASRYVISNLELRLYYESASYLFVFYDQSFLQYDLVENSFEDYPLGVGGGISLEGKGGTLTLAYALGRSQDQPLSFNLSKLHIGYVAKF
ncbi:MAG: hypothetical protein AAFX87_30555 [Bacteroidota bacterium]